jgi:hypothetical protein
MVDGNDGDREWVGIDVETYNADVFCRFFVDIKVSLRDYLFFLVRILLV